MSMNIFVPSLPQMAAHFGADYSLMQMSISVYLLMNALLQLVVGPLSDAYGRRVVLFWGFAIFTAASVACALAPDTWTFLAARMVQAAVVVGMVVSRAVIRDVTDADSSASMIAYVTMGMAVVPMISPALGGWITEQFGWAMNFWVLAVSGGLCVLFINRDLGETAPGRGSGIMAQMRQYPALLRSQRFWLYSLASGFASGAFFAYLGGAPLVGSAYFGLTPTELGIYFGAPGLGYFFGNFLAGRYSRRFGINKMVLFGATLSSLGMGVALIAFMVGPQSANVFFGLAIFLGLGNGILLPNTTAGMLSVRPELAGTASGLGGAMMIGFGALLSGFAAALIGDGGGPMALLGLMVIVAVLAIVSILLVMRRERQLGLA